MTFPSMPLFSIRDILILYNYILYARFTTDDDIFLGKFIM